MKTYIFAATYSIIIVTLSVWLWNLIVRKWSHQGFLKIPFRFMRYLTYLALLVFSAIFFGSESDANRPSYELLWLGGLYVNLFFLFLAGWVFQTKQSSFLAIAFIAIANNAKKNITLFIPFQISSLL